MEKIGIIGAGRMGVAMAYLLLKKGKSVNIWDRTPEVLEEIQKKQESPHLPGIKLLGVDVKSTIKEVTENTDLIILAVPSFAIRELCQKLTEIQKLPPILLISKGMEEKTSLLPFQVAEEVLGEITLAHITGVGYAQDIDKETPVTEILSSRDELLLNTIKGLFETNWLKIETATDILGAQLAGTLKNVMVIGIGMIETIQKEATRAKLISRGVEEMKILGKAMGASKETFDGPAGKGDLELSSDPRSRNYNLGKMLAEKGKDEVNKDLKKQGITVEGFHTAAAISKLIEKREVSLPIVKIVEQVLQGKNPKEVVKNCL